MIIFDNESDEIARISKNTTKVFIGLFGFYPHDRLEDLELFLQKELGLTVVGNDERDAQVNAAIKVYEAFDRRTADYGHVLTIPFSSEPEAKNFIEEKIRSSDFVNRRLFTDVEFIDADLFLGVLGSEYAAKEKAK
jgi:hypothetical protein